MTAALERFSRRGLALALQDTPGVPAPPSPSSDGVRFYNGTAGTEFNTLEERRSSRFFSGQAFTAWGHRAYLSGQIHLVPPPTPGDPDEGYPAADALLRIGGLLPTLGVGITRYNPVNTDIPCATADYWHGRTYRRLFDARSAISELRIGIGQWASAQLRMLGWYTQIDEADPATVTVPTGYGPVAQAANTVATLVAGDAEPVQVWAQSLVVDCGTRLTPKHYTQHREIDHADRQPTFRLRLAPTELVQLDPWALRAAGVMVSVAVRTTADAGEYTEIGARGLIRDIDETDINGDYGWEITGPCIASDAGGDELWVEFGGIVPPNRHAMYFDLGGGYTPPNRHAIDFLL